jgi:uncharacterized membrane protein YkvA (DUF1232 family)
MTMLEGLCVHAGAQLARLSASSSSGEVTVFRRNDKPLKIFSSRKGERELARIAKRAEPAYSDLYKTGRTGALDRAAEVARERIDTAQTADPEQVARDQAKVEAGFWPKVKRVARKIPFLEDLVAAYYAMTDPKTPLHARAALAFGLLYFLWMFDIIPDFLGFVGYADDGTVLATILIQVGSSITDEHRSQARQTLGLDPQ